jgi:phosphopantetheinyl transferase (holo-ACP synthase)
MPLLRLYVDVSTLVPSAFDSALSLPPAVVHPSITRYHFSSDRALAPGSALLQRLLICGHYRQHTTLGSVPLHRNPARGRPYHGAVAVAEADGQRDDAGRGARVFAAVEV